MKAGFIDTSMTKQDGVSEALRGFLYANRRRASAIRLMDTDWPQSALLRTMLVDYVSLALKDGRNALVLNAIDRGALAYEKTLGKKPDWHRLCGFLDTASRSLAMELAGTRVVSERGATWTPDSGCTLLSWLHLEQKGEVRKERASAEEVERIRIALLTYLSKQLPAKARGDSSHA